MMSPAISACHGRPAHGFLGGMGVPPMIPPPLRVGPRGMRVPPMIPPYVRVAPCGTGVPPVGSPPLRVAWASRPCLHAINRSTPALPPINPPSRLPSYRATIFLSLTFFAALSLLAATQRLPAAEAAPAGTIIELPPLEVVSTVERSWQFCEFGGLRVLSQCPADVTEQFVWDYARSYHLLEAVLSKSLLTQFDVPEKILLYSSEQTSAATNRLVQQLSGELTTALKPAPGHNPQVKFLPNLATRDRDGSVFFTLLNPAKMVTSQMVRDPDAPPGQGISTGFVQADANGLLVTDVPAHIIRLSPDYLLTLLESKAPRAPRWFIEGFLTLYATMGFTEESASLSPLTWISPEETVKLKRTAARSYPLKPLRAIFSGQIEKEGPAEATFLRAEAALFIRWCLDSKNGARKTALWKYLAEASLRDPAEATFSEIFNLSEAEAVEAMSDYLPTAVRQAVQIKPLTRFKTTRIKSRLATADEIAELKGDWQRLELQFVQDRLPQFVSKYSDQARQTLLEAYEAGSRTPGLLAVIGLYECDLGDYATARSFLESAAAAQVVRPRVYVELAKLRLAEALPPPGLPGKLTEGDAGKILALLNQGRAQSPPQLETYLLICQCLTNRDQPLAPAEITALEEGLALFPHQMDLRYNIAAAEAHGGSAEAARTIVDGALKENLNSDDRSAFAELRASLQRSP
jgi:hypothetical protein